MRPIRNENTDTTFVREDCNNLPGATYQYEDGTPAIETAWKLSDEELNVINETKIIYVQQQGKTLPPMALTVRSVFEDIKGE